MATGSVPNVAAYLTTWGSELAARQSRVRQLIGDAHWLTDGHHKEAILREFLVRYLPQECECSTGFVRGSAAETGCSPEVDIMLFSRRVHIPYFFEGGVSIIDPASLIANIEVKSSYSTKTLGDAIENVKRARYLKVGSSKRSTDLWSGVFFYDMAASRTLESALDTLGAQLKARISPANEAHLFPTCVVLGQDGLAFPSADGERTRVRAFEGKGLGFARRPPGFSSTRLWSPGLI